MYVQCPESSDRKSFRSEQNGERDLMTDTACCTREWGGVPSLAKELLVLPAPRSND